MNNFIGTTNRGIKYSVWDSTSSKLYREKNDCVVRTIQNSMGLEYQQSREFCKTFLNRQYRQGVFNTHSKLKSLPVRNEFLKMGYRLTDVTKTAGTWFTKKGTARIKTIGRFMKENRMGTFIVMVKRHAFTIKDGVIIGNQRDSKKLYARILSLYKVTTI